MKAILRNYRQSPRKVRLVVDQIRGRRVPEAEIILATLNKRASAPVKKLLDSAVANARTNNGITNNANLFIKEARVDESATLKRMRPRARGSAYVVRKRTSHISLVLEEQAKNEKIKTKK